MSNLPNNLKADLMQALNNSDVYRAASILKTLHSQVYTINISLSPAPYTSFAPDAITLQSSSFTSSSVQLSSIEPPPQTPPLQSKNMNPEIFNGLLTLGYPEAVSLRVSSLTSSIPAAVDYIIKNKLS